LRLQREPRLCGVRLARDCVERPVERIGARGCQEAYSAEVDAEDGSVGAVQQPCAAQQRAVAAESDEAVEFGGRLSDGRRAGAVASGPERLDALFGVQRAPETRPLLLQRREESA